MATISSASGYSVSAASKGFSGLMSGLDTEDMVKKLLAGTQAKIDTQSSKKQQLLWKQESYRDVISTLRGFQLSYFSFTSPATNLMSNGFYNTMAAVSSNSAAVKVGATNNASAGTVTINKVTQLATSTKGKSNHEATGKLEASVRLADLQAAVENGTDQFELTLDGVKKTFTMKVDGDAEAMIDQLAADVQKAFGSGVRIEKNAAADGFAIATDGYRQVTVSGADGVMSALGLSSGQSNKLNLNMALGKINFATPLQGGEFEFTINGTSIKVSANDTLRSLLTKINSSDADVMVSYSSVDDRFHIESRTAGAGVQIEMSQQSGNLMTALFGIPNSQQVSSYGLTYKDEDEKTAVAARDTHLSQLGMDKGVIQIAGRSLNLAELGGEMGEDGEPAPATLGNLLDALQAELVSAGHPDAKVSFHEETGVLTIQGAPTDSYTITGQDQDGSALLKKLFGSDTLSFEAAQPADPDHPVPTISWTEGQNAKFMINNVEMEKNTNIFEIDGLSIHLLEETETAVTITSTRDTEQIYKGIESFVEAYNGLLDKLNGLVDEAAEYRDYPALTAEQKAEMTENEIKLWEEKAKTGLLRNDSIITALLGDMRTALYQKPEGAKFALYELGITTGPYQDKGKLVIQDPERLRAAIESDSQEIYKLFNDSEAGLATRLNSLIDGAAKVSSGTPGSLVSLAGVKGMATDTQNTLAQQMKNIDTTIENLKRTYDMEKTRYWKQFNTMEQLIASMNQQSAWLASQFA